MAKGKVFEAAKPKEKIRPIHKLRHRRLTATIWRDVTDKGPIYNVSLSRSYKDAQGKWHDVSSFGYDDLMNVAKLLLDANTFIAERRLMDRSEEIESR